MIKYDYIIVGGGSAGCLTASRLVKELSANVLIIEQGSSDWNPMIHIPSGFIPMLSGSPYHTYHKTIPQKQLDGRIHEIAQGKVLGGSSSINGLVYMRGLKEDYNEWKISCNNAKWGWDDMLPHFKRIENNERINNDFHGINGPLKVSDPKYVSKGAYLYIKTLQELGINYTNDFNDGNPKGVGLMQLTLDGNKRCSAVDAFIKPLKNNSKLKIKTNSTVVKLLFNKNKVIGVEYCEGNKLKKVYCNNDVILTAGSFQTPKILMLSGIGPEQELRKHNINLLNKLSGVGENLQDHFEVPIVARTLPGYGYFLQDKGIRKYINGLQYLLFNSGPVMSNGCESVAYYNPVNKNNSSSIQLFCVMQMYLDQDIKNIKLDHGITINSNLMRPKSKGSVKLKTSNFKDLPLIDSNYLSNEDDIDMLFESLIFAKKVIRTKPLSDIVVKEVLPGKNITSKNDLINHCKKTVKTTWHPIGTCKMGTEEDKLSVVTPDLKVKEIENLRIFDASVMPNIVSGNTNAPTLALADRAVDIMQNKTKVF